MTRQPGYADHTGVSPADVDATNRRRLSTTRQQPVARERRICSFGGADRVFGGGGRDRIDLGGGADVVRGGGGVDTLRRCE